MEQCTYMSSFSFRGYLYVILSPTYIENGMSEFIKGPVYFASLYGTLRDPHLWGVLRRLGQDGRINPAAAPRGISREQRAAPRLQ